MVLSFSSTARVIVILEFAQNRWGNNIPIERARRAVPGRLRVRWGEVRPAACLMPPLDFHGLSIGLRAGRCRGLSVRAGHVRPRPPACRPSAMMLHLVWHTFCNGDKQRHTRRDNRRFLFVLCVALCHLAKVLRYQSATAFLCLFVLFLVWHGFSIQ